MKSFLPEGYSVPKSMGSGNYMKLLEGANKFRILSPAITGYEIWTVDNKPVRFRDYPKSMPANIKPESKVKHFWCFVVWNFAAEQVQILEITQATIQGAINDLLNSEDWGNPAEYDLTITRKGEGLDTEYGVQPSPHKPVPGNITAAYESKKIKLDALFDGENPFEETDLETVYEGGHMPPPPKSIGRYEKH